ncbi:hypothetical protein F4809DRAFT_150398 [Biscogniauxia mediterranea]|nr:hypothetical protein F4809DRAFT_150398 [Biscogniauxia mediterranea]
MSSPARPDSGANMSGIPRIVFTPVDGGPTQEQCEDIFFPAPVPASFSREPTYLCAMCMRPGAEACTKCKSCYYCSSACQETDRPAHEKLCDAYVSFLAAEPRPAEDCYLAADFRRDQTAVKFMWVKHEPPVDSEDEEEIDDEKTDDDEMLDVDDKSDVDENPTEADSRQVASITSNMRVRRPIDRRILVIRTDEGGHNSNLGNLLAPYGTPDVEPEGNLVMCTHDHDIRLSDIRHAIDWFMHCEWDDHINVVFTYPLTPNMVQGIRVTCVGRAFENQRAKPFEVVQVPIAENVGVGVVSQISQLIGVPFRAQKVGLTNTPATATTTAAASPGGNGNNPIASALMRNVADVDDPNWGLVPEEWDGDGVGDVLFVREDGEPLLPGQMEVWGCFAATWLHRLFQAARSFENRADRLASQTFITREKASQLHDKEVEGFTF